MKEQLEAAKPEPVIEEVVSAGPPVPLTALWVLLPHLLSALPFLFFTLFPFQLPTSSHLSFLFLPFSYLCPPSSCVL